MPKQVSYTRAKMSSALQLAEAVHKLGGQCKIGSAADELKMAARGGGFNNIVTTATKLNFLQNKKGELIVNDLFKKEYLNAYDEEEKKIFLQKAFLNIPLYNDLYQRFAQVPLPEYNNIPKLLVREYDIDEKISSRVSKYFLSDAKTVKLLDFETRKLLKMKEDGDDNTEESIDDDVVNSSSKNNTNPVSATDTGHDPLSNNSSDTFKITISGPGYSSSQYIETEDDLEIVKTILDVKIKKRLKKNSEPENNDQN